MSDFEAIGPVANRLALWNERRAKINAETDHPGAETLCTLANAQRRHVSALLARAGRDRALASLDPSGLPPA
ncbi:MAG: hypothetical protein EOM91_21330 [Sphingobacteriia bacterium]|jgi:hypothetical protein|nr:hypothetical protein [Sphingobacteriia bacterium]